jgi:N-carbamoyl-L-amino-acid hydrolase
MTTTDRSGRVIDRHRLLARLQELGEIGKEPSGGRTRLALTSEDKEARDRVVMWLEEAGAQVRVDRIGNIYGLVDGEVRDAPVMIGSHIDTVPCAGAYDGCYGVVAGIEVLQTLIQRRERLRRRVIVAAFTNEEGVRFAPDLLGSRVLAKDTALNDALAISARDGALVGEELQRIGYAGETSPWELLPGVFVELHIEQGPLLDAAGIPIGVVEAVQGHSWWRVTIEGAANHAGTTPMDARRDAGAAAMSLATKIMRRASDAHVPNVATVGTMTLEPNVINIVPGRATFTIDFRDHRNETLRNAERQLEEGLRELQGMGLRTSSECVSRHAPVRFDAGLCALLEALSAELGLPARRMLSGASHDAQMMAGVCPTAMIFVPSHLGISHNPREHTEPDALARGADLLLYTVLRLASDAGGRDGIAGI